MALQHLERLKSVRDQHRAGTMPTTAQDVINDADRFVAGR
jgi:hypothetical protein